MWRIELTKTKTKDKHTLRIYTQFRMQSVKIIDRSMPFIALVPNIIFKVDGTHETKSPIFLCMDFAQWNETAIRE